MYFESIALIYFKSSSSSKASSDIYIPLQI